MNEIPGTEYILDTHPEALPLINFEIFLLARAFSRKEPAGPSLGLLMK
jgi:hypothetical protein